MAGWESLSPESKLSLNVGLSQSAFTCSKSTIETSKQWVKSVQS